jgi:SAM-dependent methyltransferase
MSDKPVFDRYSRYYDLLYRDKAYAAEAAFVDELIRKHAPAARSMLELGCGSGVHAKLLAERGYRLHGIDRSDAMVQLAQARKRSLPKEVAACLSFETGDVRRVQLGRRFDAAISLFHVVSYQTLNADLKAMFRVARAHLEAGGIFLFDCWYGPAVLKDRPVVRVKRMEDEAIRVTRIAEPTLHPNECVVDVAYQILVEERSTGTLERFDELHRMRYLFLPEIELLAEAVEMDLVRRCEWLTGAPLGEGTWSACFVARAR